MTILILKSNLGMAMKCFFDELELLIMLGEVLNAHNDELPSNASKTNTKPTLYPLFTN